MAEDVFEDDDRVVDQSGQGESQTTQHHAVDGISAKLQDEERREHRQRNGKEHGDGRAQAAEEDQNHQAGQKEADASLMEQRLDRGFHKARLIENHLADHRARNVVELGQLVSNTVDDCDRVRVAALLEDRQVHARAAR